MSSLISRRNFTIGSTAMLAASRSVRAADLSGVTLRVAHQVGTYKSKLTTAGLLDNLHEALNANVPGQCC